MRNFKTKLNLTGIDKTINNVAHRSACIQKNDLKKKTRAFQNADIKVNYGFL